jgi:hypothetical protein
MSRKPDVNRMLEDRDLFGLMEALRYPGDPDVRMKAAGALGEIGDLRSVESMLRSCIQDPDEYVKQAARSALSQILGNEAKLALAAYLPPDEPWIQETPQSSSRVIELGEGEPAGIEDESVTGAGDLDFDEELEEKLDDQEIRWEESDIPGLIAVIRTDHSRTKRIEAIRALSQIGNMRAIDALASIAIWSEESRLRREANQALQGIYGDDLEEVLENYKQANRDDGSLRGEDDDEEDEYDELDDEDDDEDFDDDEELDEDEDFDEDEDDDLEEEDDDEESWDETGDPQSLIPGSQPIPFSQSSPVIQEEKPGYLAYALFAALFFLVLAGLLYFLFR